MRTSLSYTLRRTVRFAVMDAARPMRCAADKHTMRTTIAAAPAHPSVKSHWPDALPPISCSINRPMVTMMAMLATSAIHCASTSHAMYFMA